MTSYVVPLGDGRGDTRPHLDMIRDEVEYLSHQVEGVRDLVNMIVKGPASQLGFILADDMGLGKSLEVLTVAAILFQMGRAKRILVVCPSTLKGNWEEEIALHTNFTTQVLAGTPATRLKRIETFKASTTDVLIVNYEQVVAHVKWTEAVRNEKGKITKKPHPMGPNDLDACKFDIVIYDEAHLIKNRDSARTMATLKLVAPNHFILTGSPILNNVDDLWTLLHKVDPYVWPNYWTYKNRYVVLGGYNGKQVVGVKNETELHEKLKNVMVRRLFEETMGVDKPLFIPQWVDLHPAQRKLYDEAYLENQLTIPNEPDPQAIENALVKFLRLKEICGTTASVEGYTDVSAKLDRMEELAAEVLETGKPLVIFTQFRKVLQCAADRLGRKGMDVYELHGDIAVTDRVPTVRFWSEQAAAGKPGALVAMHQVGGVGLNMTAANTGIFIDKLWVPKLNEQSWRRLARIGQDFSQPIRIFELIARKTVEQRVEQINKRKSRISSTVVDGDNSWKKELVRQMKQSGPDDDLIPD